MPIPPKCLFTNENFVGSPGRIRTSDQPVNRGTAYRAASGIFRRKRLK